MPDKLKQILGVFRDYIDQIEEISAEKDTEIESLSDEVYEKNKEIEALEKDIEFYKNNN